MNQSSRLLPVASRILDTLWPFQPADLLVIAAASVGVSILAFNEATSTPSWAGWWLGAFVGSLIVCVLVWRRCRASAKRASNSDEAR